MPKKKAKVSRAKKKTKARRKKAKATRRRTKKKAVSKDASTSPENWPASRASTRATQDLVPYARNARIHSTSQVDKIVASIREWGWTIPVLVDEDDMIIAGHGRILAAETIGLESVPVIVAEGWTDEQKRAYVLADNKLTLTSDWDMETLSAELGELGELAFNLDLTGFSSVEVKSLLGAFGDGSVAVGAPRNEWRGMPDFEHEDLTSYRRIVVHFKTEEDIAEFAKRIDQKVGDKTRSLWFPPDDIGRIADKRYGD